MNHNGILTSQEELEAHGYRDYETIQEVGEFILRLILEDGAEHDIMRTASFVILRKKVHEES